MKQIYHHCSLRRVESNHRPRDYEARILPLNYAAVCAAYLHRLAAKYINDNYTKKQEAWEKRISSCRIRLVSFVLPCIGYTTRPLYI